MYPFLRALIGFRRSYYPQLLVLRRSQNGIEFSISFSKVVRVDWLGNLAKYEKDCNVSLFHVVCTVTVRISFVLDVLFR